MLPVYALHSTSIVNENAAAQSLKLVRGACLFLSTGTACRAPWRACIHGDAQREKATNTIRMIGAKAQSSELSI